MEVSYSPYNEQFYFNIDEAKEKKRIDQLVDKRKLPVVVVQGLGFVGSAMCAALSEAEDKNGNPKYIVIGVDLADKNNYWKIARVCEGQPPVISSDSNMKAAYVRAKNRNNLTATYVEYAYSLAQVIVVDVHLDIDKKNVGQVKNYILHDTPFKNALLTIANNIHPNTLVLIETTVPPGTTEKIALPLFQEVFKVRDIEQEPKIAHSYERVMPGENYLSSITNYYRVYAGANSIAAKECRAFLESFIDTTSYPLCEMHSTNASEMAKVLENSYRAMNIAFIQEWTKFAHQAQVNLFEVIEAIRKRKTHNNIMLPGFGVGGYCLTKDALLADYASQNFFEGQELSMSLEAIAINDLMPDFSVSLLREIAGGSLKNRKITLLGISYLNDIADTRFSPSQRFYETCKKEGAEIFVHDPLVTYWKELDLKINPSLEDCSNQQHDLLVFAVRHKEYLTLTTTDIQKYFPGTKGVLDAFNIISDEKAFHLQKNGISIAGVGKGHWDQWRNER